MEELLALAEGFPRQVLGADDALIIDGAPVHALFVLLDGALRIEKDGVVVATVTERGTCVGEMSLLLGIPATASVVADQPSTLGVIADAPAMLAGESVLALALARLLARRLQAMTTYLVDLRQQYADHEGGLGMIDVVLGGLMRNSGARTELRSERDPEPEY
jgi:CRP/FNR family transcriptional regulator, cyclic AMP receptor protein